MSHPLPRFVFWISVACCLYAASCAGLWRAAKTGGPAAGGAAVGSVFGGPVGAGVGAGAGAIIGSQMGENEELRDGELVGKGTIVKYITKEVVVDREVEVPVVPTWAKWAIAVGVLWGIIKVMASDRYRTLIFAAISNLMRGRLPTAIDNALKASGVKHSRDITPGGA